MRKSMRVLVTGSAGFIGSHTVDSLVNCGYGVRVIDNLSTGKQSNIEDHLRSGRIDFVRGDIKDVEVVRKCVRDVEAVVHLARLLGYKPKVFLKDGLRSLLGEVARKAVKSVAPSTLNF